MTRAVDFLSLKFLLFICQQFSLSHSTKNLLVGHSTISGTFYGTLRVKSDYQKMGKKMGINTKAVEARERKNAQKKAKNEAIERQKEDAYWRDDDKHINRKLDRQKEKELKAQQERERKAALKEAYEQDMTLAEQSAKAKSKQQLTSEVVPKITRHEIHKNLEEEQNTLSKQLKKVNLTPIPLAPNLNRLDDGENASTVDEALELLKSHSTLVSTTKVGASAKKR